MDKLGHMRSLVSVAKLGSFSAAARVLGVTPGMMSKQVKQLEDELDVRLLHRTTRGVSLTEAGEQYVGRVVDILQQIEDAESTVAALSSGPRGTLRINCPPSFGTHVMTPIIAAFLRQYADIRIDLGLQDEEPDVIAERLDVIFRLGKLRDSSLVARQVGKAGFVLCAAPAYTAARGTPRALGELAQHDCIVDRSIQADGKWSFENGARSLEQAVSGPFTSVSTEAVIAACVSGIGLSYLPCYAVREELALGELMEIELADAAPVQLPVYALYGSREHVAAKVRDFLKFFEQRYAAAGVGPAPGMFDREPDAVSRDAPVALPAAELVD